MLEYKAYLGTLEPEDGSFVGRAIGLRDVITFDGESYAEVQQAFRDSVDDYLAFCAEPGEPCARKARPTKWLWHAPIIGFNFACFVVAPCSCST
ncbi:hypothetical protein [uncultured Thiohalocapsa sp.]|uniref:hypothetical protein n=1 Tax=uncultured Thiohalocapsa sp. TaxID=768990 RepID=UPI0025FE2A1B|nr:hypothetical protein [uncultured Thiohalocapsa sp.]